ncbi:MAG: Mth938-like domain-containing protein, partial [Pseudomonadota bacterium]
IAPLPADVRQAIEAAGIGVEVMSTPSACRTYNVLLSEGRRVACALTAV